MSQKGKKLKKEYRKIKDKLNETGQGRNEEVQWVYFDAMDQILGHKPTTVPEMVIDSLALAQTTSWESRGESSETLEELDEVDETLFGDLDLDETIANGDETIANATDTSTTDSPEPSSSNSAKVKESSSKKKKHSRGDQFKVVMDGVMKELVSAQERNEKMYLELEQKRMKMEEKMFEKELEMQKESRQFQLQMMQMMTSMVNNRSSPPFPVHLLSTPITMDQCIVLMMMILHKFDINLTRHVFAVP